MCVTREDEVLFDGWFLLEGKLITSSMNNYEYLMVEK